MVAEDFGRESIPTLQPKIYKMKKINRKHLFRELKKIQSRHARVFSEKEYRIISLAITELKKVCKPKSKWIKTAGKIVKRMTLVIRKMF